MRRKTRKKMTVTLENTMLQKNTGQSTHQVNFNFFVTKNNLLQELNDVLPLEKGTYLLHYVNCLNESHIKILMKRLKHYQIQCHSYWKTL